VWGNEIVVGFMQGYFKNVAQGHAIDGERPNVARFARSKDGGLTWTIEVPSFLDAEGREQDGGDCPGAFDFAAPNSAVALRMVSSSRGFSRFYYSNDRAKTWQGPYRLPTYDRKGIAARTDYLVDGKHSLTAFITASKENGREGRVLCIRTEDGGKTWDRSVLDRARARRLLHHAFIGAVVEVTYPDDHPAQRRAKPFH
jgi:hypothetical protein